MLKDFNAIVFHNDSTAYFLVSFLSACAQFIARAALYVTDNDAAHTSSDFARQLYPNVTQAVYYLTANGGLKNCTHLPSSCNTYSWETIKNWHSDHTELCAMIAESSSTLFRENSIEDILFVVIHAALVFFTVYAIARESTPHIITIFVIRFLNMIWSISRLVYTTFLEKGLYKLVDAGSCQAIATGNYGPFLSKFFETRHIYEMVLVITSVLSLLGEAYVAYRVRTTYSERPWRVVEVPSETHKMYRQLLGFSVVVQLAAVFVPATNGMWAYLLLSTWFREIVGNDWFVYGTVFIVLSVAFPVWMALGWFSLRKERRRSTIAFLVIGLILLSLCLAGLGSATFLWSLTTWWFFGSLYAISLASFAAALIMAVICRRNFGNNLDHYLDVKSRLSAMGFAHDEFEKDEKLDNVRALSYMIDDSSRISWTSNWKRVSLSD